MLGPRRALLLTLLFFFGVVAEDKNVVSTVEARRNNPSTQDESLADLPTSQLVEHVFPSFQSSRINFAGVEESYNKKSNNSLLSSTRGFPSYSEPRPFPWVNPNVHGIHNITKVDRSLFHSVKLGVARSLEVIPQLPMFWPQQVNPKSRLLAMLSEKKMLKENVNERVEPNSRDRALPQSYSIPIRSYSGNTPERQISKNKLSKVESNQADNTMNIYTIFKNIKHHREEEEKNRPQMENRSVNLQATADKSLPEQARPYALNIDDHLPIITREQRELDLHLLSRVQDLFSKILDTNSSFPVTINQRAEAQVQDPLRETNVEPASSVNLFTKLKCYFTSWCWNKDENNSTDMKIELEEENDSIEEAAIDLMKEKLIEKLEPVLTDTFGHRNITSSELMSILDNPVSIKDKLLSRTSEENARELIDAFSFYEGLPHSKLVDRVANANTSLMAGMLSNVGSEVKNSLFEMLVPSYRAERSVIHAEANRSQLPALTNVIQPKNINISFAITTSPYKNSSFFGGHDIFNLSSSYYNFSKNSLNYTHLPSISSAYLAALPILATLTTGALFGLGGVIAILIASHYHYGKKKDYDYDYDYHDGGYGYSQGYHTNPIIISLPHGDNKGGYGSHSAKGKISRQKTVRGKVKKGTRVRLHRGTSHKPHKHGGGGGGGGYNHRRLVDDDPYFYDDFDAGRTSEKIDWKYSKESDSPRFVRLRSKEIVKALPIVDSAGLFGSSYEKISEPAEFEWIYDSRDLTDKGMKTIYSAEILGKSSERTRHDKREIFESWEKGRKSIYSPLRETSNRASNRRRQPTRKRVDTPPYRGTLVLEDGGPLGDILYGKNSGRRSSSKVKRKSWRDRDSVGQHSVFDGTRVSPDGGSPLGGVGNIPGIDWALEPKSKKA